MDRKKWAEELLDRITEKMEHVVERNVDRVPYIAYNGRWDDWSSPKDIGWWTNGFWGGILWACYRMTGKAIYREEAVKLEGKQDSIFMDYNRMSHDSGFRFLPTAVEHYRQDGNEDSKRRGLAAANNLAGRFNIVGRYIKAWEHDTFGPRNRLSIIDTMMNLPLLYWCSEVTEDPHYSQIAEAHAESTMKNFIREDGSVCHIIEYDENTGEVLRSLRGQGYAVGSSWTRGQGWAIYGFALSYGYTGRKDFLETSRKVADYFISSLNEDCIVPCDFRQDPDGPFKEDDTAAACVASGLLELAKHLDEESAEYYRSWAYRLLDALVEHSLNLDENVDYLISTGTAAYHKNTECECPIIYGDYYFIEALMKTAGIEYRVW